MKRIPGLFRRIYAWENLELALRRALIGKRERGDAQAFMAGLPGTLADVGERLRLGKGPEGRFTEFVIFDPKERLISAPCFADRVLHHAMLNVCGPVFERYQVFDSYACRMGKGQFAAIARAIGFARHHERFLKLDFRQYFGSIPRGRLWEGLTRRFREEKLLELWWQVIDSYRPGESCGLPIGSLTSQHLANDYLARLDHEVKETWRLRGYVRYMDDLVAWAETGGQIRELREQFQDVAGTHLGLELKPPFSNRCRHGMEFLGYRIYPWGAKLSARSRRRFRVKWKRLREAWEADWIGEAEFGARAASLCAFTERAACKSFRRGVIDTGGVHRAVIRDQPREPRGQLEQQRG